MANPQMNSDPSATPSTAPAWPVYLALLDNGELERRVIEAYARLEECSLRARHCRVNRRLDQRRRWREWGILEVQ